MIVREVEFERYREFIADFRATAYGDKLSVPLDEFDQIAHHFFLFDDDQEIVGMVRLLRSDEVSTFEIQEESSLQDLVLPDYSICCECSRLCTSQGSKGLYFKYLVKFVVDYCGDNGIDYSITCVDERNFEIYTRYLRAETCGGPFIPDNLTSTHYPIVIYQNIAAEKIDKALQQ
ncbi:MAG: GNAT family N-acetyltransferase [Proteobacteria bacterium]|nr:GNAT family N-acetyltransferase [Pseudomonadota bacterium]